MSQSRAGIWLLRQHYIPQDEESYSTGPVHTVSYEQALLRPPYVILTKGVCCDFRSGLGFGSGYDLLIDSGSKSNDLAKLKC